MKRLFAGILILGIAVFAMIGEPTAQADVTVTDSGERVVNAVARLGSIGNTTVTFQDGVSGYTGTRDTYIYHVSPATVRGAENLIIQDKNPSNVPDDERTSLLQFDLSAIPANVTIVSAQLDFYVDGEGQGFNMYRMKVPWNEATASFASIGNRHFFPEGIDAEIAVSASWPGVDGYVGPITVSVPPSQISDWVNGVMTNNGWLMVSAHHDDGVQLRSSEHSTVANRPKLTVVYNETPPNFAPAQPVVVAPPDDATDVSTSPDLEISVADPNANSLTVTYYGRPVSTAVPGADFTVIAMPDTQHYVDNGGANAANFYAQTQWIVANKDALNIRFVTGLGDITENGNAFDSEWQIATNAYSTIEDPVTTNLPDGISYGLAVGNHDQTPNGGGDTASTAKYNQYFGITRFNGRSYYGGHYGSDNDNHYQLFSGGGMDFIIIHLEYDTTPLPAVLTWADGLLQTHSNRRAIVTTHWMVGMGMPAPFGAQGAAIYNELKDRPNLFMLLGGHVHTEGRRQDTFEGRTVHGILSDYQSRPNGGNGLLRIMTFSPANNTISVKTYSPSLGQFETDFDSQFTLSYDMSGSAPFQVIGTNTGVPSGTNTSINWPGLTTGTEYEWYATVSDGTDTTTGPVWSFTTAPAGPTPTNTATNTPTDTPTSTATNTATATPTPTAPCVTAGSLDTSFDGDGKVTTAVLSAGDYAYSVAIQADGKIVAAGYSWNGSNNDFAVVRYNTDGSLDITFDGDGKVTTDVLSSADEAYSVAIQADGTIVATGYSWNGSNYDFAVVRYNADGSLDTTFDGDGRVTTAVQSSHDLAYSAVIQADGRIVAVGVSIGPSGNFAVVRYNADGSLDTTFDGDGKVTTAGLSSAQSVAIQADGRIVAAGVGSNGSNLDFAVVRYNSDGSLDTTFDGDGKVTTAILSAGDRAESVAIQADGKIVVAGRSHNGSNEDFAVVRYNADGSLDTTFDGDGKVTTDVLSSDDNAYSVAIQADGKIVAAGYTSDGSNYDLAVVRYNADGSLDTTFDGDGKVTTVVLIPGGAAAEAVAIQADGKIVAAGYSSDGSNLDFAIVRYNGDGPCATPTNTATDTPTATNTPTPEDTPSISGTVTYGNAIGAPTVRFVSNAVVCSSTGQPPVLYLTDPPGPTVGQYTLTGFGTEPYTIVATKSGGQNGSITSFDAAKIAQHVSGIVPLTGNQLLVSDVSNNAVISSFDAAQIARYVISSPPYGITSTWKMLPASRSYSSVTTNITGEDYSALLMGEVSGNWTNTGTRPAESGQWSVNSDLSGSRQLAEGGDGPRIIVDLPKTMVVSPEKEIVIPVNVHGVADKEIISYEFDLRYDPTVIQPQEIAADVAGTASRGLSFVVNSAEPGLLRVAVYGAMPIEENGVLLNLRFMPVGAPGSVSPLTWERIIFNEGSSLIDAANGQVELSNGVYFLSE